jgi:hypothetical protein
MDKGCAPTPEYVTPYRRSITQPHVYWTLDAPFGTIIGLYSNVEGGLDARGRIDQQTYLQQLATDDRKNVPQGRFLFGVRLFRPRTVRSVRVQERRLFP